MPQHPPDSQKESLLLLVNSKEESDTIIRDSRQQKQSVDDVRALTDDFERRVKERTVELEESRTRLRSLIFELNKAEQMERQRLATELHDSLAQLLTAGQLTLESMIREVGKNPPPPALARLHRIILEATRTTRRLMTELSGPPVLEHSDLVTTMEWVAKQMREDGLAVEVVHNVPQIPLDRDLLNFLYQSVRELLLNIQKHAGVTHAAVIIRRTPGSIEIEVGDDGRGISKESTPDTNGGFGLLTIQERLRWLQGTLTIESVPGRGTLATLTIPIKEDAESGDAIPPPAVPTPIQQKKTDRIAVLLVDDHRMIREGLRSVIEETPDIQVVGEAADGVEALEKTRELRPDVVLMDINMPRMGGLEATQRILREMPEVTIIGLSLHSRDNMEGAMLRAGAAAYLSKEEAFDTLCETIRNEADSRK